MSADAMLQGNVPGGLATIFQHLTLIATGKSSDLPVVPFQNRRAWLLGHVLKRVAIFQIRSSRFRPLFLRISFSQNRGTLLRDML
ncbi:hypothetical protein J3P71_18585 [Rhizobium leguminosarum]|uniref:hypothetical protein n=1 Tax=Rhizobium leguminosarum TaxID=384 RepID=UPI0014414801|nr:hypothetical protein [Rhizobium leguminosarum]MBY5838237.1 hypothetical protein [Rhizobium leguminosarum]NKM82580.1 hypothetical protein [Rhizobium leguminosarum bv. viciae]QSZ06867.1 hypothetical protein J3P71_18585 [Rhizobium leguminosarum]